MGNNHPHLESANSAEVNSNSMKEVIDYLNSASEKFNERYYNSNLSKDPLKSIDDFEFYQCLGSGAFASVYLAREISEKHKYLAVKMMRKNRIIANNQAENVLSEKRILNAVEFPFIVELFYTFQDSSHLCLAMEFMKFGELFGFLRKEIYFNEINARFYCAQVLLALEYMHHLNIAYRDLKPENILIGNDGYLKLADFGFAKLVPNRTYTICGTPEYLAPEIIAGKGYGRAVDWWAFGVLVFELNAGYSPFFSNKITQVYQKILNNQYLFPKHFSRELRSLLKKLLEYDTTKRIGCLRNKVNDVKTHKWFNSQVYWKNLFQKQIELPKSFITFQEKHSFKVGNVTLINVQSDNDDFDDSFIGF